MIKGRFFKTQLIENKILATRLFMNPHKNPRIFHIL